VYRAIIQKTPSADLSVFIIFERLEYFLLQENISSVLVQSFCCHSEAHKDGNLIVQFSGISTFDIALS
jgi:hypothetical protein